MDMMIITVFILGYICIALEHPLHIDKGASALILGMLTWAIYVFTIPGDADQVHHIIEHGSTGQGGLIHHLYDIASILFFLLGAMTIVETVDSYDGFSVITDKIKTTNKAKLLWIVATLTFFFSAVLDNLTTTIVMVSLLRKLIDDRNTRLFYVGMVVIAANAGGAWSPIGDVTTTMLWIGGQLTTFTIVKMLFLPSLVTLLIPLFILSFTMKGDTQKPMFVSEDELKIPSREKKLIFFLGVAGLLFVPVFKTVTHLPPFMGMMLSLGVIWLVTELLNRKKRDEIKSKLSVLHVLGKIDTSSVLFFLGILMGVAALQEAGFLNILANTLRDTLGNIYSINIAIGLISAMIDNVPLVAASMGMYEITSPEMLQAANPADIEWLSHFVVDGEFWQFLAYCAGTGGSALIIGSAAGVAAMGLERIDFIWYLKKISLLAVLGYLGGALFYILVI
jgi:Na+/H+ antiporter NhaD/arsenite permease-like protein